MNYEALTLKEELDLLRAQVRQIRLIKPNDRTEEHWKIIARESQVADAESYERCDTDGFLSQWAHQQMQGRYLHMATVAKNGGTVWAPAVFDLQGNIVTMDLRDGDYGSYWFIKENEGKARFFTESGANKLTTRRDNNAKKGYRIGSVRVRVEMTEYDCKPTDEVVEVESIDTYGDWIAEGRERYFD